MMAVWGCLVVLLADLFDRFERRFAIDLMRGQNLPTRWVAWGLADPGQTTRWVRYFMLRLPSWYAPMYCVDRWAQWVLLYTEMPDWQGRRWRVIPVFE